MIRPKPCWKPAAVVIKLFWKSISKTYKGFGKPLIDRFKASNLLAAFRNLFMLKKVSEINLLCKKSIPK